MRKSYFDYTDNFALIRQTESTLVLGGPDRKECLFTIAIPTYKRAELIETSLKSAVNQRHIRDFEVIIVDNDPEPNATETVVRKYLKDNVYYFKNKANVGLYNNWNKCIDLAKGRYITILNDDDWLSVNFLAYCKKYLKDGVDGLYFGYHHVYEGEFSEKGIRHKNRLRVLKERCARETHRLGAVDFIMGNKSAGSLGTLFNVEKLMALGGYNAEYHPSSDYVLHSNYCTTHNVLRVNKQLCYYRIAENESAKQAVLKTWEYMDTDIRHQLIQRVGKNRLWLLYLNMLTTDIQIKSLIENWNYETDTTVTYNLQHRLFEKISGLKFDLNR